MKSPILRPLVQRRLPLQEGRADLIAPSLPCHPCEPWHMTLELEAEALRNVDPLPMLLAPLTGIPALREQRTLVEIVVSELYSNALEHGVLRLDSRLKTGRQGFERFLSARTRRLACLRSGWVRLSASYLGGSCGGFYSIRVDDSGGGFDPLVSTHIGSTPVHGRGLDLVRSLCRSLIVDPGGSSVSATYAWTSPVAAAA